MGKQPKDTSTTTFQKIAQETGQRSSDDWKAIWKKVSLDYQKTLTNYMGTSKELPLVSLDKSWFNPDEALAVFTQTMQKLSEYSETKEDMSSLELMEGQVLSHSPPNRFQTKPLREKIKNSKESQSLPQ